MCNTGIDDQFGEYSDTQIQATIESGHITCAPYNPPRLKGSSLDLMLGGKYQSGNDLVSPIDTHRPNSMLPRLSKDTSPKALNINANIRNKGKLIVLEGNDGTGKTTQASLLYYRLAKAGVPMCGFMLTEPGQLHRLDTPEDALAFPNWDSETYDQRCLSVSALAISRLTKDRALTFDPQTRLLLHTAAHRAAWAKATRNALSQGLTVIATRNWVSALVYQGYGDGVDKSLIENITRNLVGERYFRPDITLILNHDNENDRLQRIDKRGEEISVHEEKNGEFQQRINKGYQDAAKRYIDFKLIDAADSVDAVHERVWWHVAPIFNFDKLQFPICSVTQSAAQGKITKISNDGVSKLRIVLDFDRTLSMNDSPGTFDILKSYLPEAGKKQYDMLYEHYRPRDANGTLTSDESALWTSSVNNLMQHYQVNLHAPEAANMQKIIIRPHVKKFFSLCDKLGIPIIIISGGVKNIIDQWCEHNGISPTIVIANQLIADSFGDVKDWERSSLIHPLNKHTSSHPGLTAIESGRPNTVLIGDSLNDWNMAGGDDSVLRILISDVPLGDESGQLAAKRFDMTLGTDAFKEITTIIKGIRNA